MQTILVVDDEPTVLTLCQRILKMGGYEALSASGPEQALKIVESNPGKIDLAVLDVIMPGMNGIELAQRIQGAKPETRILLMSGFGPKEIARIISVNPYRMIWKPFKTESLLRMIENALSDSYNATA